MKSTLDKKRKHHARFVGHPKTTGEILDTIAKMQDSYLQLEQIHDDDLRGANKYNVIVKIAGSPQSYRLKGKEELEHFTKALQKYERKNILDIWEKYTQGFEKGVHELNEIYQ